MDKIPFNLYDWFGYLISGAVVCFGIAYAFDIQTPLTSDQIGVWRSAVWLAIIYIGGHLNAHLAQAVLEHGLVFRFFGRPEDWLLSQERRPWWSCLIRDFTKPLTSVEQEQIRKKEVAIGGTTLTAHETYRVAFNQVKNDPATKSRLDIFIAQYGAFRNLAFSVLVAASILAVRDRTEDFVANAFLFWCVVLVLSTLLFLRYLKFFKIYTREVLSSYAGKVA